MLILNRHPFSQIHREMDELFGSMLSDAPTARVNTPPMNIWEESDKYFVEAELPGYRFEDLEVGVLGHELTVKGTRTLKDAADAKMLRRERVGGSFIRTWTLPVEIDADKVEASLTNGVLLITLPKSPQSQPRKITVKAASA